MSRIEFQARRPGGPRVGCAAGFDPPLHHHFLTIEGAYSNLDQPGRMGLNLLRLKAALEEHLQEFSWPELLLAQLDADWRASIGLGLTPWPCQPHTVQPYLLVLYPDKKYSVTRLMAEHLKPGHGDFLDTMVRQQLGGITNRVYADMVHPDSPARGYLTWCRDEARMLEPNPFGRSRLGLEYELGGPLAVAMHVDDAYDPDAFGPSEVEA